MFSFSKSAGLCVLLAGVFASASATAESKCQLDTYELAPTLRLREEDPECYKQITKQIATRDKYDKYHLKKTRGLGWLFGEFQLKLYGGVTNEFESWQSGLGVLFDTLQGNWGVEAGWMEKKWLRDFWASIHPDSYLDRDAHWAIDAMTITAKFGYTGVVEDVLAPQIKNEFTYTVKASYTLKFDNFTGDLD